MSYEGYDQCLCGNGHLFEQDCYNECNCDCGSPTHFLNSVDNTNGDDVGIILSSDWKKFLISEEKSQTCNLGHVHVTHRAIYRIPKADELVGIRSYKDWNGKWRRLHGDAFVNGED